MGDSRQLGVKVGADASRTGDILFVPIVSSSSVVTDVTGTDTLCDVTGVTTWVEMMECGTGFCSGNETDTWLEVDTGVGGNRGTTGVGVAPLLS